MMNVIQTSLAVFFLSLLITREMGPFEIFIRFRIYIVSKFGADNILSQIIQCSYCTSVYIGFLFYSLVLLNIPYFDYIIDFFSIMGLTYLVIGLEGISNRKMYLSRGENE